MNFTPCDRQGTLEGYAIVRSCEKKNAKNGTVFLDIVLSDKSGEISAKLWDFKDGTQALPEVNSFVKVRGAIQMYSNAEQFIIQRIRPVVESDGADIKDYVKSSPYDGDDMFAELMRLVSDFKDGELKTLISSILEDEKERLLYFPAAYRLHHAVHSGLLWHTLSVVRLAEAAADIYPYIDRDLLLSGAIIHDIEKLSEFRVNATGLADGYTERGELVGHLVMGAMLVDRKCAALGISSRTATLLEHMLISHHGLPEYGAAVKPAFIEAELLAQLDLIDAQMYEMSEAVAGVESGGFTGRLWALDNRKFFNHGRMPVSPDAELGIRKKEEN